MPETALETVARLYRAVVADAGSEGISRGEATLAVLAQVRPLIQRGAVTLDPADLIRVMVEKVDKTDGKNADTALADIASGVDDLGLDAQPILDRVVTLGRGRRKAWRFITAADVDEMDAARYANVRAVSKSYREKWRSAPTPRPGGHRPSRDGAGRRARRRPAADRRRAVRGVLTRALRAA